MKETKLALISVLLLFCCSTPVFAQQTYWWNNTVFYELFVRSFYDSNGDGIGDFNGIRAKLDYLNDGNPATTSDLGIGAIWLMPINPSPSYHGYDVTNYKGVNPQYGTKDDFKKLVQEAHQRGIKVIMDFVINHSSDQHPWFTASATGDTFYRNFYRWESPKPTYAGPWGQQVWYPKNGSNYYAVFWSGMPDLNYNSKKVQDSIFSAAKYWFDSLDIDGYRLDAAQYLYENGSSLTNVPQTLAFWKTFNDSCEKIKAGSMTVGEVWTSSDIIKTYSGKLDYCFEFSIAQSLLDAYKNNSVYNLASSVNYAMQNYPFLQFGTFLSNHDQNRTYDYLGSDLRKCKAAASALLTLPGIPYLYYGEEVGMIGSKPDENIRKPMQWSNGVNAGFTTGSPWESLNANFASFNVATESADSNSLLNQYKKMIHLRTSQNALKIGKYDYVINDQNAAYTFLRHDSSSTLLVMHNTSDQAIASTSLSFDISLIPPGSYLLTELLTAKTLNTSVSSGGILSGIGLNPYESKIFKLSWVTGLEAKGVIEVMIYPNPCTDALHVMFDPIFHSEPIEVIIVDLSGHQVRTNTFAKYKETEVQVDVSDLTPGMYFLSVQNSKAQLQKKFIKN